MIEEQRDRAYLERNALFLALCSTGGKSWVAPDPSEPDWMVVFLQLPAGQVSFHIHAREFPDFMRCPFVQASGDPWDGHETPEKWRRVLALIERYRHGGPLEGYRAALAGEPYPDALRASGTRP